MAAVLEKELPLALANIFTEDSENESEFHGFCDNEIFDKNLEDKAKLDLPPEEKRASSKPSSGAKSFRLRVALGSTTANDTDDDDEEDEDKNPKKRRVKNDENSIPSKRIRHVRFEDQKTAVAHLCSSEERVSDEDESDSFLTKRQQNIKANKAMLAQLMADLEKMPGGAGLLKKQVEKQRTKGKSSRPLRSQAAGAESRRNPERASRRHTRSMGGVDTVAPKEEELEYSLEEELLEVRRAPRQRGTPRPNQSNPHLVRPVEDITEEELQLVADNMTEKVYNRLTGSTCHQCRQKTVDTKTCCRSEDCRGIQGQFCGPCLRNRYGEDVRKALLDPEWKCPPCRGICNCSFCRQREGRCPTGILFPLAQYHGFSDVHSYLSSLRSKVKNEDNVEM